MTLRAISRYCRPMCLTATKNKSDLISLFLCFFKAVDTIFSENLCNQPTNSLQFTKMTFSPQLMSKFFFYLKFININFFSKKAET